MSLARVKSWIAEVLTPTDLNAEFNNILNYLNSGVVALGGSLTVTGAATVGGLLDISGAAAGQIKFAAAQNASSDVNTLDDYEEGTWTPSLTATSGTATYSNQAGNYCKVGRLVFVSFDLSLSAVSTLSGPLSLAGLPFTLVNNASYRPTNDISFANLTTSVLQVMLLGLHNSTTAVFKTAAAATASVQSLTASDLANNTDFQGSFMYLATA